MANWLWFVTGLILLIDGSTLFVRSAVTLAEKLRLPKSLVAGSIVAIGTSLPELSVTISAVVNRDAGLAIGNIVGSNISNVFLILGLVLATDKLGRKDRKLVPLANLLVIVTAIFAFLLGQNFSPLYGVGLLALSAYLVYWQSRPMVEAEQPFRDHPSKMLLAVTGSVGLLALVFGAGQLTRQAEALAAVIGLSDFVVGLVMLAVGTSLPELAATVAAIRQRESSVATNTLIGSNLFNITLIGGAGSLSGQFHFPLDWPTATMFMASALVALMVTHFDTKAIFARGLGALLLAGYGGYLFYLIKSG